MAEVVIADVETTGVKKTSRILECSWALIHPEKLTVLGGGSTLVHPGDDMPYLEPEVREMHEQSGLLKAFRRMGKKQNGLMFDPEDVVSPEHEPYEPNQIVNGPVVLDGWLAKAFRDMDVKPGGIYLCGMSIQFDRRMIETYCPSVVPYLSHRQLDLSTIRELGKFWAPLGAPQMVKKDPMHRAMADVEQALETLRWVQREIWRIPNYMVPSETRVLDLFR